jgi:NAD(P)-dependent dehydrogenase (short-subunit alcohol dehydrogenase family)
MSRTKQAGREENKARRYKEFAKNGLFDKIPTYYKASKFEYLMMVRRTSVYNLALKGIHVNFTHGSG